MRLTITAQTGSGKSVLAKAFENLGYHVSYEETRPESIFVSDEGHPQRIKLKLEETT